MTAAIQRMLKGTRLSPEWKPSTEQWDYARGLKLNDETIDRIALDFCAYWSEIPGQRGLKITWNGTWQTWCRREADRRGLNGGGGPNSHGSNRPHRETIIEISNELSLGLRAR